MGFEGDETPSQLYNGDFLGGTVRDGGTLSGVQQEGGAAGEESGAASRPGGLSGGHYRIGVTACVYRTGFGDESKLRGFSLCGRNGSPRAEGTNWRTNW